MTLRSTLSMAGLMAALFAFPAIPAQSPVPAGTLTRHSASSAVVDAAAPREAVGHDRRAGMVTEVILNPIGRVQETMTTGTGFYMFAGIQFPYDGDTVATKLVYGDDGDIYFYNILPYGATNSYVRGRMEGDKVVVSLPQTVSFNNKEGFGINLDILEYHEGDDSWTYHPATDRHFVSFSIGADDSLTLEPLGKDYQLGYVWSDNDGYLGYGATALHIRHFEERKVEVPEGAQVESWSIIKGDNGGKVDIAFVEDDLYIGGIFYTSMPDAWIKGHIVRDGGRPMVAVSGKQYLGMDTNVFCYLYFMTQPVETEDDYIEPEFLDPDYEYMFLFDEEGRVLRPVDPEIMLVANLSDEYYYSAEELINPIIRYQESFAGTPADPYDLQLLRTDFGQNGFIFFVPSISTEATALDTKCLFYEVYVNDELFTFDRDAYRLTEDMTRIPYLFDNDFISNYGGSCRWIWFPSSLAVSNLSVILIYDFEGEETSSNLVTLDLDPSSAFGPEVRPEVVSECCFDLTGRRLDGPAEGICIVRRTYSDGRVRTVKIIR